MMKRRTFLMLAGGALTAGGCGGGAPNIPREAAGLKLDISWPERTRGIDAPSSALSAVIGLESVGGGANNFPVIERNGNAAYLQNYVSPSKVPTGVARLLVRFFSQAGGRGVVVAEASKVIVIKPDGTGAGTVTLVGKVASVRVTGKSSIRVGESASYSFSALDAAGATIALSPGSVRFSEPDASTFISVEPSGTVTGLAVGRALLLASVDGKTSEPFEIEITAPEADRATIAAGQSVGVGQTKRLVYSIVDGEGNPVTLDPALISFTVITGQDILEVNNAGDVTGKKVGTAQVRLKAGQLETTASVSVTNNVVLKIAEQQVLRVGESKKLEFTATDAAGNPLQLGAGAASFQLVSGGEVLGLQADGMASGQAAGVAVVTVTVSGVVSPAQSVFVGNVTTTETGLKIIPIVEGGGAEPTAGQNVTVHYTGTLLNGTRFDSSRDRDQPSQFNLDGVIAGFSQGLQRTKVGGRSLYIIPPNLGYGASGQGSIPPNATLIFDVELISIP